MLCQENYLPSLFILRILAKQVIILALKGVIDNLCFTELTLWKIEFHWLVWPFGKIRKSRSQAWLSNTGNRSARHHNYGTTMSVKFCVIKTCTHQIHFHLRTQNHYYMYTSKYCLQHNDKYVWQQWLDSFVSCLGCIVSPVSGNCVHTKHYILTPETIYRWTLHIPVPDLWPHTTPQGRI